MSNTIQAFGSANKKRKVTFEKKEDDEQSNMFKAMKITTSNKYSSDDDSDAYQHSFAIVPKDRPPKRTKRQHRCSEVLVTIPGTNQVLRTLIDSGTSSCIINKRFVDPAKMSRYKRPSTKWKTMGGIFETKRKAQVTFHLAEFSLLTWTFHVDESREASQYDMIIGDDLMQDIGLDLLYSTEIPTIQWERPIQILDTNDVPYNT